MTGVRVLVCGSRTWRDGDAIRAQIEKLGRGATIITGGARGADRLAESIAESLGFDVETYLADWSLGRGAGIARNLQMLGTKPDLVLAFQQNGSRGTQHVIDEARRRRIPLVVVTA